MIFILFPKSFESGNCFDVGCCWNPSSDVKPSLLHFTFWIYRNKSTNRTGHRTIIVVVKTFRSVVMQNILIQIHHQIFWLPWISIIMKCHYYPQNGDGWSRWASQHLQCVCKWTIEQGVEYEMKSSSQWQPFCILQDEFVFCWSDWIKKVARPSSALVVVDVQNDFISGSLAIINCPAGQNGEDVS